MWPVLRLQREDSAALVFSTDRRPIHSSCSFFISHAGSGPSQDSSQALDLQARGEQSETGVG